MTNTALTKRDNTVVPRFPSLFRSSLFDDLFAGLGDFETALFQKGSTPCDIVEVKDNEGNVVANEFSYALAGFAKDDVKVEIDDNLLTISAEKTEETNSGDENRTYLHRGLTRKSQKWSYVLNSQVDAENVSADMKEGILKVTVPILPQKKVKQIEVK